MPELYLAQHGKAYPENVDPERRLTPEGIAETEAVARYLKSIGASVNAIIHSGKARARQTAEIFARYLNVARVEEASGLNPNDDPRIIASRISEYGQSLMIVGHLPHLSRLASLLLVNNPDVKIVEFKYSGVLKLTNTGGSWVIEWFITPNVVKTQ